jgi:hypothetical protein
MKRIVMGVFSASPDQHSRVFFYHHTDCIHHAPAHDPYLHTDIRCFDHCHRHARAEGEVPEGRSFCCSEVCNAK